MPRVLSQPQPQSESQLQELSDETPFGRPLTPVCRRGLPAFGVERVDTDGCLEPVSGAAELRPLERAVDDVLRHGRPAERAGRRTHRDGLLVVRAERRRPDVREQPGVEAFDEARVAARARAVATGGSCHNH